MKVLIIDDEALVRLSLKRVLESQGEIVFTAEDGAQGLDLWRKENPDLVFLDVIMPKLTGPEVLTEVGKAKKAKVVLMSAYAGEQNQETAKQMGADLFLEKPFENIFDVVSLAKTLV